MRRDVDRRLASDTRATHEDLARIAADRPDLRPLVAANPAAYPALVQWLDQFDDPAIRSALEARAADDEAADGEDTPRRRGLGRLFGRRSR